MHPEKRPCFLRRAGIPRSYGQCNFPKGSKQFNSLWVLLSTLERKCPRVGQEAGERTRKSWWSCKKHSACSRDARTPPGLREPGPAPRPQPRSLRPPAPSRGQFAPAGPMRPRFPNVPQQRRGNAPSAQRSPLTGTLQAVSEPRDSG